jgi:hypothetical protein
MLTKLRLTWWFVAAAGLFSIGSLFMVATGRFPLSDPFYCGGRAVADHRDPYAREPLSSCEHAVNPVPFSPYEVEPAPFPGYVLGPLSLWARADPSVARVSFDVAAVVAAILAAWFLWRATCIHPVIAVFAMAPLAFFNFAQAQIGPFYLLWIAACGYFLVKRRAVLAAIAATLALLEPHIGLPVVVSLFFWRPRSRIAIVVGIAVLGAISLAATGIHGNFEYFRQVLPAHARAELAANDQYSLSRLLYVFGLQPGAALTIGTLSYLAMALFGIAIARPAALALDADELIAYIPAAAVLLGGTFIHDIEMIAALPAAFSLVAKGKRYPAIALIALSLLVVAWEVQRAAAALDTIAVAAVLIFTFRSRTVLGSLAALAAVVVCFAALSVVALKTPQVHSKPASAKNLLLGEASDQWGFYLRSQPERSQPTLQSEMQKVPTWVALALLLSLAGLYGTSTAGTTVETARFEA